MKLRVLAASVAALTLTAGIASAQTKPATPAAAEQDADDADPVAAPQASTEPCP